MKLLLATTYYYLAPMPLTIDTQIQQKGTIVYCVEAYSEFIGTCFMNLPSYIIVLCGLALNTL